MPYCQVSDVVAVGPGVEISATSKPTSGAVTVMIANIGRELDAQFTRLGYVSPVIEATSPKAFAVIKHKVAHAALAEVLRAKAYGAGNPNDQGADAAQKVFDSWLKALKDVNDPTELPDDATRTDENTEKVAASHTSSSFTSATTASSTTCPPVSMGDRF